MTSKMINLDDYFVCKLVDMGEIDNPNFHGVYSPEPEVGRKREGVNAAFLEDAEEYYVKHQGYDYWNQLFAGAFRRLKLSNPDLIVEYGCGFGNSTLPLLALMPDAKVIASDISPNLLAIGRRLVEERGYSDRCAFVAMDAQVDYIRPDIADVVVGSAILHHLAEPRLLLTAAMRVLKPNGCAIFFEPFEIGYALIRMLLLDILNEASRRDYTSPIVDWMTQLQEALAVQIQRDRAPGWRDRDDKWIFSRNYLQDIADDVGAELIIYPLETSSGKFRSQIKYMLTVDAGFKDSDMPDWGWSIIDRLDNDIFSPDLMPDLLIAGAVIFKKR